ncbi:MAG: hypothetical protein OEY56_01965 [Cyclobacteriaceae bacterium]|nr:hypothetical protein [Cyclobacteriaceae bacterium]
MFRSVINNVTSSVKNTSQSVRTSLIKFKKSLQPSYTVHAITYFVLPGIPVNKNISQHHFERGEYREAKAFYEKVIRNTETMGFSPAEIHLIKGRKKIIARQLFGPVEQLEGLPMTINS